MYVASSNCPSTTADASPSGVRYSCQWALNAASTSAQWPYRTLDLLFSKATGSGNIEIPGKESLGGQNGLLVSRHDHPPERLLTSSPVNDFLTSGLDGVRNQGAEERHVAAFKLILPTIDGYLIRSDFLEKRLSGSRLVAKAAGFVAPREGFKFSVNDGSDIPEVQALLATAIGGILLWKVQHELPDTTIALLETELHNRITFPWFSPSPISRKRLAFVEARQGIDISKRMWEAAAALGIDLVVIDKPGHWLEDDHGLYAHFREAFIPTDISVDQGFTDRIISAVRSYPHPIDGVMTVSDSRLIGVAKACEILKLPTSPSTSYILAADKYKTRMMEPIHEGAFQVSSVPELQARLNESNNPPLTYPLIVKPTLGWGSECVTRVASESELISAVDKASARHALSPQQSRTVAIEPYIDGPEVDVNFVILKGEVLFFSAIDDFPSTGDSETVTSASNFLETQMMTPSRLPAAELAALKESVHQSILRQGFTSGCFHCEARLWNSHAEYRTVNGLLDLYEKPRDRKPTGEPGVWLLEINARPPGYMETAADALVYGVDYFGLQMLFSLGREAHFPALTSPFRNGPQYNLLVQFVPQDRVGIMKSEDTGAELLAKNPDIAKNVPEYKTWVKKGGKLLGPAASEPLWLSYFLVVHEERTECLRIGGQILERYQYEMEEES